MSPSTSAQLMTEAVIAQYIHEISVRHRARPQRSARQADVRSGHVGDGRRISAARRELTRLSGLRTHRPGPAALPSAC